MNDEKLLQLIAASDPVPDAAALHPEPGDETPLLLAIYQRSGIMEEVHEEAPKTEDPHSTTPGRKPATPYGAVKTPRRWRTFGAAAAAVLIVAAIGVGAWLAGSNNSDREVVDQPAQTTVTTGVTTTTTSNVEAVDGPVELVVSFDGEACSYSGPDGATLSDEISLTFVNESEDVIFAGLRRLPPDRLDELMPLVGTDFDWSSEVFISPTLFVQTGPHGEDSISAFVAGAGTYVVDCTLLDGAIRLHSWWPATLEVTP